MKKRDSMEERMRKIKETDPDTRIRLMLLLAVIEDIKYHEKIYRTPKYQNLPKAWQLDRLIEKVVNEAIRKLDKGKKKLTK